MVVVLTCAECGLVSIMGRGDVTRTRQVDVCTAHKRKARPYVAVANRWPQRADVQMVKRVGEPWEDRWEVRSHGEHIGFVIGIPDSIHVMVWAYIHGHTRKGGYLYREEALEALLAAHRRLNPYRRTS